MVLLLLRTSLWSCLPEELVMEVFNRLPDKELLGFRCISKKYYSLISKSLCPKLAALAPISGFVFQWKPHNTGTSALRRRDRTIIYEDGAECSYSYVTPAGYFDPFEGKLVKSYLSLLPFKPKIKDFLGCFSGFFLVRHRDSSSSVATNYQYFVCNPVTKQCVSIPVNSKQYPKEERVWIVGLAFDPMLDIHNFKVVRISLDDECKGYPFVVDVFSSAMGRWDSYQVALDANISSFSKEVKNYVYANGVFYMLSLAQYLVRFDLLIDNDKHNSSNTSIKARAIKLPNKGRIGLFASSKGCLYYACITRSETLVWTFQVGEEDSPWIPKYSVSFDEYRPLIGKIIAVDLSAEIIYFS